MRDHSCVETLSSQLLKSSGCPLWLADLLATIPGSPTDVVPHNKPRHSVISSRIADAFMHPAMEACLHLINTDLYSAHFIVRKAQGGAKYIDWLHAILHKFEGDYRNAKMWYTDLGNSISCPAFAQFWSVRQNSADSVVSLTAAQHTDLVAITSAKPGSFQPQKYYASTTASAEKIMQSEAAYSLADLQEMVTNNDSENRQKARSILQLELVWLLHRMHSEFGWDALDASQTMIALQEQAQREDADRTSPAETQRKGEAHDMVFGAAGQRKF